MFERGSVPTEETPQDQKRRKNQKLALWFSSCDHFHYSASEWRRLVWNALVKRYGYLNITMDTSCGSNHNLLHHLLRIMTIWPCKHQTVSTETQGNFCTFPKYLALWQTCWSIVSKSETALHLISYPKAWLQWIKHYKIVPCGNWICGLSCHTVWERACSQEKCDYKIILNLELSINYKF